MVAGVPEGMGATGATGTGARLLVGRRPASSSSMVDLMVVLPTAVVASVGRVADRLVMAGLVVMEVGDLGVVMVATVAGTAGAGSRSVCSHASLPSLVSAAAPAIPSSVLTQ